MIENTQNGLDAQHPAKTAKQDRSSEPFPYVPLQGAIDVAKAIFERAGHGACENDEIAVGLNQTVSGAFRLKTSAARMFGLTERVGRTAYRLTDLGRRLVSEENSRPAQVEAFLSVPLYAKIYEAYRGSKLPPPKGLENEMAKMGVAPKQTDKARQALERSAQLAGFFESGNDRLVKPRVEFTAPEDDDPDAIDSKEEARSAPSAKPTDKSETTIESFHPFIQGLLKTLPEPETEWPATEREKWLALAGNAFDLIYKDQKPEEKHLADNPTSNIDAGEGF